jgi:hypothetical protein
VVFVGIKSGKMFEYFNGYWRWVDINHSKITPVSSALYFYILRVSNDLGWPESFNIVSTQAMHYLNIKSYKTYKSAYDLLLELDLIKEVEKSKNQWTCNRIGLVKFTKAHTKASTKHIPKHMPEQVQSTHQSTSHIHKTVKDFSDLSNLEEGGAQKFGTRVKAWFTNCTKDEFLSRVEKFQEFYPTLFLREFTDHYLQESHLGGFAIHHYDNFDMETKLRKWWNQPDMQKKYAEVKSHNVKKI